MSSSFKNSNIFGSIDCNSDDFGTNANSLLYPGSTIEVRDPKVIKGKFTKDFGYGFYVTLIKTQADRWSNRFSDGIVSVYRFDRDFNDFSYIKFNTDDAWLDFVVNCRLGIDHDYDIVEGPMADDTIYSYVNDFVRGDISRSAFWELAKFKYPTHQIAFCSDKALKHLNFKNSYEVKFSDKKRKR